MVSIAAEIKLERILEDIISTQRLPLGLHFKKL